MDRNLFLMNQFFALLLIGYPAIKFYNKDEAGGIVAIILIGSAWLICALLRFAYDRLSNIERNSPQPLAARPVIEPANSARLDPLKSAKSKLTVEEMEALHADWKAGRTN